ncbi:metallophosphoesterase [Planctomicrobium sp. SH664]|uniref:metallophosphoesterase n=1 Tax=Planctomicrobium sp. SH664 TaxID=3448125 RepID=UPI003F5C87B5
MRVGIFADTHDHLDNIRRAVKVFNDRECACVLFAGDLVSTFAVPPLRQLKCPFYGCFGDNEGNKIGLVGGLRLVGQIQEAPALYTLSDGTRVVLVHMERQLAGLQEDYDMAICGHTHRPAVKQDEQGRLLINPGETSGWTFGQPTVALLETDTRQVEIVPLDVSLPLPSWNEDRRQRAAGNAAQALNKQKRP